MPAIRFDVAVYGIIYGNISRVTVESWQCMKMPTKVAYNIQGSDAITALLFRLHKGIYQRESCLLH